MSPYSRWVLWLPTSPAEEENRRYHRIPVTLPVEYVAFHPESGESYYGQGQLRNFSLSGAFFQVSEPPPVQPGCLLNLRIIVPLPPLNEYDPSFIHAQGVEVRLEGPHPDDGSHGIAVQFRQFPFFAPGTSS